MTFKILKEVNFPLTRFSYRKPHFNNLFAIFSWLFPNWIVFALAPTNANLISTPPFFPASFSAPYLLLFIHPNCPYWHDSHTRTMRCDGDIHMIMPQRTLALDTDVSTSQIVFKCALPSCYILLLVLFYFVQTRLPLRRIILPSQHQSCIHSKSFPLSFWNCKMFLSVSLYTSFSLSVSLLSLFFCSSPCWQDPIYQLISAFPGTLPTGNTAGGGGEREREWKKISE